MLVRLGYCFTPYQRLRLYNGAHLVAFYDTLGYGGRNLGLKPPASPRGKWYVGILDSVLLWFKEVGGSAIWKSYKRVKCKHFTSRCVILC